MNPNDHAQLRPNNPLLINQNQQNQAIPSLEKQAQISFAKKVYSILLCQFIVFLGFFYFLDINQGIAQICFILSFIGQMLNHRNIGNFNVKITMLIFTLTYSYFLGYFTIKFQNNSKNNIPFWPITILLVICLKIYAYTTQYDFTSLKAITKNFVDINIFLINPSIRETILTYMLVLDIGWLIIQLIAIFQQIEGRRSITFTKDKYYQIASAMYFYVGMLYYIFALLNSTLI